MFRRAALTLLALAALLKWLRHKLAHAIGENGCRAESKIDERGIWHRYVCATCGKPGCDWWQFPRSPKNDELDAILVELTRPDGRGLASGASSMPVRSLLAFALALAALPAAALDSRPGAPTTIYIDMDGAAAQAWGQYAAPAIPAYAGDRAAVWANVADKFSPFDVNVTTVDPGTYPLGVVQRILIGGGSNWVQPGVGGATYTGGFTSDFGPNKNTSYVFPDNLQGDRLVGLVAAHEAGHGFGLFHQPSGIMSPDAARADQYPRWTDGTDADGVGQDDVGVLGEVLGWGAFEPGLINNFSDIDSYDFVGVRTIRVVSGGMLSPHLRLDDVELSGLTVTTGPGPHTLDVMGGETYGDFGSYTLTGLDVPEPGAMGVVAAMLLCGRGRR